MNQVVLMGRLTRPPELRKTRNGTDVAAFTLAVDRGYATGDGERQADFIDCVAWRGTATFICKYFGKGKLIAVTGRMQTRVWTDDEGNRHKATEVVVDNAFFTGEKRQDAAAPQTEDRDDYGPVMPSAFEEMTDEDVEDGELPF